MLDSEELQRQYTRGAWHDVARLGRDFPVVRKTDAEILRLTGAAARRILHLSQAAANLQAAVMLDPWNGPAWCELGMAWFDLRQLPIAEYAWTRAALLGAADDAMERTWEVVRVATGRKPADRAAILARIQGFDHLAGLPSVAQIIPDDSVRLPVLFSLGSERRMEAALTIDDAPSPDITPVILDTLRSRSVHAVFFIVGQFGAEHPDLIARIVDEGHEVFAHSWSHTPFINLDAAEIAAELDKTEAVLRRARPTPTPYPLRLPGGMGWREPRVHEAIRAWNPDAVIVHWNVDTLDYRAPSRYRIADDMALEASIHIMETIHDPLFSATIMLCHDNMVGNARKPPELFRSFFGGLVDAVRDLGMTFGDLGL